MKKNRLFSLLLCAALVLSMLPIPAAAATISVADETELLAALTNGSADDITLTADISISTTVSLSYSETINFDSHTLTMDGRIDVGSGKTLTLTGPGTFDGTTITGYGAVRATGGTVNVNGGLAMTFTGTSCIQMSSGEVNVTNGTLSGATYGVSSSGGAITVSGGSVSGTTYGIATSGGTTSISGGTVEGGSSAVYTYGGTVGISSGTLNGTTADVYMTDGIVNVTGATLGDSTYGITMSGGTANVTSGTVSGTTYGINATGGLVNVSGTGSVSGDNTGIYANGGDVNVSGGSVSGPVGIDVSSVTSDIDVYGGTVTGTGTYGITTSSGTVDVYGTGSVSGNNTGIDANGGDVNVSGGTVSGPMGINVRNSNSDLVVSAGTVTGSGSYGIGQSYGTVTVSGTGSVTGNTAGIYKSGGSLTVSNGTVTGPNAVQIGGGSANISGGNLVGATNDVYMTDGSVNINGVSLSGANYGINATGGTITMNSGSVTGTTRGVNITGAAVLNGWGGTITNGITAADTGTVRVRDNVVSDTIGNITMTGTALNVYTVTYYDKGTTYDVWYIAEGDTPILTVPADLYSGPTKIRDYTGAGTTSGWNTASDETYTAHGAVAIAGNISLYAQSTQSTSVYSTVQNLAKTGTDLTGWVRINLLDQIASDGETFGYIKDTITKTIAHLGDISITMTSPVLTDYTADGGTFDIDADISDGTNLSALYIDPNGVVNVTYDGNGTNPTRTNYYDLYANTSGAPTYNASPLLIKGDVYGDNVKLAVTTDAGSATAPTRAGHATAVADNPEYLITAQPYRFSFVLESISGVADNGFTVKWYKIRGDYKITGTAPTLLSVTTNHADGVYYADITVDESYYYFAVISDSTTYFNTDPAVTGYDYATLGSTAADTYDNADRPYYAFVQQTYITSNIQVVSTTNYIVSGALTTTEAATEFTVGSTYHLEVPDASVKDAQGYELTEGTDYDVTYQIAQNGWDWQDIGTNVVTPANTTCMYRAKITPADGSKYVGTYYTNTILTPTARTATLTHVYVNGASSDTITAGSDATLRVTTNTGDVGQVEFFENISGTYTYIGSASVESNVAQIVLYQPTAAGSVHTYYARYVANSVYQGVDMTGTATLTVNAIEYSVTGTGLSNGTGYTVSYTLGTNTNIASGGSFTFTVTTDTSHDEAAPLVTANGLGLVPTAIAGSAYTYKLSNITSDFVVTVVTTADAIPTYNVSFLNDYSGAPTVEYYSIDVVYNNTVTAFSEPVRAGYTFGGWYTGHTGTGTQLVLGTTPITGDAIYYAKWTQQTYTTTFNGNGGTFTGAFATATTQLPSAFGTVIALPDGANDALKINGSDVAAADLTLSGYEFMGWATDDATADAGIVNYAPGANYTVTGAYTLYAVWEAIPTSPSYQVTGAADGVGYTVSDVGISPVAFDGSFSFKVTTATGYTDAAPLVGANGLALVPSAIAGNVYTYTIDNILYDIAITIVAIPDETHTDHVSFLNDYSGAALEYYSIDVVHNGTVTTFAAPSRAGYTFDGWFTDHDGAGTELEFGTTAVTADIIYYAKWTPVTTYTVSYPMGEAAVGYTVTPYQSSSPVNTGGSFSFYVDADEGYTINLVSQVGGASMTNTNGLYTITNITATTTITVTATKNTYTITYDANGGAEASFTGTKTYGEAFALASSGFTRTGYNLVGWSTVGSGSVEYNLGGIYTADFAVTLYAVWQAKTSVLTMMDGAVTYATADITYGSTTNLPVATQTGITFNGWFTASVGGTQVVSATGVPLTSVAGYTNVSGQWIITGATTLYAQWSSNAAALSDVFVNGAATAMIYEGADVTLSVTTNTGDVGEVQFFEKVGAVYTYIGSSAVETNLAQIVLSQPAVGTHEYYARYLANTVYLGVALTGTATLTVNSATIYDNGTTISISAGEDPLTVNSASTLSVPAPRTAAGGGGTALTYSTQYTIKWYHSDNGGPWVYVTTAQTLSVTPDNTLDAWYAEVVPAGVYTKGAYETTPIGGSNTKLSAGAAALTANPTDGNAYEGETVTLTATFADAVGGTVYFYSGTTFIGSAPLTSHSAAINYVFGASANYDLSAVYSGNDAYNTATGTLPAYTVNSATLPLTTWTATPSVTLAVGTSATLSITTDTGLAYTTDYTVRWEVNDGTNGWSTLANAETVSVNPPTTAYKYRAVIIPAGDYTKPVEGIITNELTLLNTATIATTTTLTVSDMTPFVDETITLTASVNAAGGYVTFKKAGATVVATAPLGADGKAVAVVAAPAIGSAVSYTAEYTGNITYADSTSAGVSVASQSVTIHTDLTTVVAKNGGTTYTTLTPGTAYVLSVEDGTDTIKSTDSAPLALTYGQDFTVNWYVNYNNQGWTYFATAETVSVTPADDYYAYRAVVMPAGHYSLPYEGITLAAVSGDMAKATSTVTLVPAPADGSVYAGQTITLTATVTMGATGIVDFYMDNAYIGSAPLVAGGTNTAVIAATAAAGDHTFKAIYGGDTLYASDDDEVTAYTVLSAAIAPVADDTVTPSDADAVADGLQLWTAAVAPAELSDLSAPTLSIGTATTLYAFAPTSSNLASGTLNPVSGEYTVQWFYNDGVHGWLDYTDTVTPGQFTTDTGYYYSSITVTPSDSTIKYMAAISPDGDYTSGGYVTEAVGDASLHSSATDLTATPGTVYEGDVVTLEATASGAGTVYFYCGATYIGSAPLASGTAQIEYLMTTAGSYTFTAIFSGNSYYATSSDTAPCTVNSATLTGTWTISAAPALAAGTASTLSVTIPVTPVYTTSDYYVVWQVNSGSGWATYSEGYTASVTPASDAYSYRAVIMPKGDYTGPSAGISTNVLGSVAKVATETQITVDNASPFEGASILLSAGVYVNDGIAGFDTANYAASGTVTFLRGSEVIGTAPLGANGIATLITAAPAYTGSAVSYTAIYSGTTFYATSSSSDGDGTPAGVSVTSKSNTIKDNSYAVAANSESVPGTSGYDTPLAGTYTVGTTYQLSLPAITSADSHTLTYSTDFTVEWYYSYDGGAWTLMGNGASTVEVTPADPFYEYMAVIIPAGNYAEPADGIQLTAVAGSKALISTDTAVTFNPSSVYEGQPVAIVATVTPASGTLDGGIIDFYKNGAFIAAVPVDTASGTASYEVTADKSTDVYKAVYCGTSNFAVSIGSSTHGTGVKVAEIVLDSAADDITYTGTLTVGTAMTLYAPSVYAADDTLFTTALTLNTNYSIQWMKSVNNGEWTDIGTSTATIVVSPETDNVRYSALITPMKNDVSSFFKPYGGLTLAGVGPVDLITTATTLASSVSTDFEGKTITLTASVSEGAVGGTVTFYADGAVAGIVPLTMNDSGQAKAVLNVVLPAWSSGDNDVAYTAKYSGNDSYSASTASATTVIVKSATLTVNGGALTLYTANTTTPAVTTPVVGTKYDIALPNVYAADNTSSALATSKYAVRWYVDRGAGWVLINDTSKPTLEDVVFNSVNDIFRAVVSPIAGSDYVLPESIALVLSAAPTPAPTATTLTTDKSTYFEGGNVVLTATVLDGTTPAAGIVKFYHGDDNTGTLLGSVEVSGTGTAVLTVSAPDYTSGTDGGLQNEDYFAEFQANDVYATSHDGDSVDVKSAEIVTTTLSLSVSPAAAVLTANTAYTLTIPDVFAKDDTTAGSKLSLGNSYNVEWQYSEDGGLTWFSYSSYAVAITVTPAFAGMSYRAVITPKFDSGYLEPDTGIVLAQVDTTSLKATDTTLAVAPTTQYEGDSVLLTVNVKDHVTSGAVTKGTVNFYRYVDGTADVLLNVTPIELVSGKAELTVTTSAWSSGAEDSYYAVYAANETYATSQSATLTPTVSGLTQVTIKSTEIAQPIIYPNTATSPYSGTYTVTAGTAYTLHIDSDTLKTTDGYSLTTGNYTIQWLISIDGGITYTAIPGAIASTYNVGAGMQDGTYYKVRIIPAGSMDVGADSSNFVKVGTLAATKTTLAADKAIQYEGDNVKLEVSVVDTALSTPVTAGTVNFYRYVDGAADEHLNATPITLVNGEAELTITIDDWSLGAIDQFYAVYTEGTIYDTSLSADIVTPDDLTEVTIWSTTYDHPEIYPDSEVAPYINYTLTAGTAYTLHVDAATIKALDGKVKTSGDYTIQWLTSIDGGTTYTEIPGATAATYNVGADVPEGTYYMVRIEPAGDMDVSADSSNNVQIGDLEDTATTLTTSLGTQYEGYIVDLTATVKYDATHVVDIGTVTFAYSMTGAAPWTQLGSPVTVVDGQASYIGAVIPAYDVSAIGGLDNVVYRATYNEGTVYDGSSNTEDVDIRSTTFAVPTFKVFEADGTTEVAGAARLALATNTAYILTVDSVTRLDAETVLPANYTVQWESSVNSTDGSNGTWTAISGATGVNYTVPADTAQGTWFRLKVIAVATAYVKDSNVSTDNAKITTKVDTDTTLTTSVVEEYEKDTIKLTANVVGDPAGVTPTGTVTFYLGSDDTGTALATVVLDSNGQAVLTGVTVPDWAGTTGSKQQIHYYAKYNGSAVYNVSGGAEDLLVKSTEIQAPLFAASYYRTSDSSWPSYAFTAGTPGTYTMTAGRTTYFDLSDIYSYSGQLLTFGKDYTVQWYMKANGSASYQPIDGATGDTYQFTAGTEGDSYMVVVLPIFGTGDMLTGDDSTGVCVANVGTRATSTVAVDVSVPFDVSADLAGSNVSIGALTDGSHYGQTVTITANVTGEVDLIADGGFVIFYDNGNAIGTVQPVAEQTTGGTNNLKVIATMTTDALAAGLHTITAQFVPGVYYNGDTDSYGTDAFKVWSTTMDTVATYWPTISASVKSGSGTINGSVLTTGATYTLTLSDVYTTFGELVELGSDYYIVWQQSSDGGATYSQLASTQYDNSTAKSVDVSPDTDSYAYRAVVIPYTESVKLDIPANGFATNIYTTDVATTTTTVTADKSAVYYGNDVVVTATIDPATASGDPTDGTVFFFYSTSDIATLANYTGNPMYGTGGSDNTLVFLGTKNVGAELYMNGSKVYYAQITTDDLPLKDDQAQPVYLYAYYAPPTSGGSTNVSMVASGTRVDVYSSYIFGETTGYTQLTDPVADTALGIAIYAAENTLKGDGAATTLYLKDIYTLDAADLSLDPDDLKASIESYSNLQNVVDYTIQWQYTTNYTGSSTTTRWYDIDSEVNTSVVVSPLTANYAYRAKIVAVPSNKTTASGAVVYYSNVLTASSGDAVVQMAITPASSYIAAEIDGSNSVDPFLDPVDNLIMVDAYVSGGTSTPTGDVTLRVTNQTTTVKVYEKTSILATGGSHKQFEVSGLGAGIYTFSLAYSGSSGYNTETLEETYIVRFKPSVALDLTAFTKTYDGTAVDVSSYVDITALTGGVLPTAPVNVQALAMASLTFRYECQETDGTWTWVDQAVDAGHYRVKAILPETKYFLEAESDYKEFDIAKKDLSIGDIVYQAKTYDTATAAYPLSIELIGVVTGDSVFVTGTAATTATAAGATTVTFTPAALCGPDMANYNLPAADTEDIIINRSQLTVDSSAVSGTALTGLKVFDAAGNAMTRGTQYTVTYYYHDGTGVKATTSTSTSGKYTVVIAPADTTNYKGGESFVMNVASGSVTFDGNDATAPDVPTMINYTATQYVYSDDAQTAGNAVTNSSYTADATGATQTDVGRYNAAITAGGETEYGILSIYKAEEPNKITPVVKVGGTAVTTFTYGTAYTVTGDTGAFPAGTYLTFVGGDLPGVSYEQPKDVGTYLVTAHVPASANYVAYTTSTQFTISKARITITADDLEKLQYSTNPRWTVTYSGNLADDFGEYRDMLVLPSFTLQDSDGNTNVDLNAYGYYTLTPGEAYSKNYDIVSYVDGTFTVVQYTTNEYYSIDMSLVGAPEGNIYYGDSFILSVYGNYSVLNVNTTGVNTGDRTIENSKPTTLRVNNSSVLKYEIVQSYNLSGTAIADPVASIDQDGKVQTLRSGYFTVKLTRGTGDDAIYTYATYRVELSGVGIYMDGDNRVTYDGDYQTVDTSKYLVTTGGTLEDALAAGIFSSPTASYSFSSDGGTTWSGTDSDDAPVNAGKYLVNITVSNAMYTAAGYGLLIIEPKAGTITADDVDKQYGDAVAPGAYTESGNVNNVLNAGAADVILDMGVTAVNMSYNSDKGDYELFTSGGTPNANYVITYVSGDYDVAAKTITVTAGVDETTTYNTYTAQDNEREYGTVNPVMGYTVAGFINGDGLADLMISDSTNKAFVAYSRLQEDEANLSGANHAVYVNDHTAVDGHGAIALNPALANANGDYLNYTITDQNGLLDIYQADVAITVISLTVPIDTTLTQSDFFAKVENLLTTAPMSDTMVDLGLTYKLTEFDGLTPVAIDHTTADGDPDRIISVELKTGTALSPQNYWENPAQVKGELKVSSNVKTAVITIGRTSSSATITENAVYLPVYKWTDTNTDTIKDASEMTATGWYVRNDADGWTTDDYNSVSSTSGTPEVTTASYAFFNNSSTLQYAKDAEIAAGDYYVLEGDTNKITKVEKFNVGDIYFYIFDSNNNVVREGTMPAVAATPGVYVSGIYTSLPNGTYRIILIPQGVTTTTSLSMSPMGTDKTFYAISPYTTTGTLSSSGGGTPSGGTPSGGITPILETEDHFAYIIGDNEGNFNPLVNMTRAEAATIFYRLLKDQSYETDIEFTDVTTGDWYYDEVMALAAKGIIEGYDDGQFKPGNTITRAEFCAMASRFFEISTDNTFDFDDVSKDFWAYKYIMSAAAKGWVNGYENDDGTYSFKPGNSIKRAEVVKIVNAMLERVADENYIDKHADDLTSFADLQTSYWAYYQIMEAANGHVYTKDDDGNETWTKLK